MKQRISGFCSRYFGVLGSLALIVLLALQHNERARRNAELDASSRSKAEFLSNISHQLKTPLTVVSSSVQTSLKALEQGGDLEAARSAMKRISGETERMAMMVTQLTDVTRIEEGRMSLNPQPVFLPEILQYTLQTYYPEFTKNNNRLELSRGGDSPTVLCDPSLVTRVLVSLLSNAARHTRDGRITIEVKALPGFARISVSDTGEGIDPALLPRLFERYTAGERETGTGLGLYFCRHIITAHGGEIDIRSTQSIGTTVRFTLPLAT